jgi:hypothetical protein
MLQDKKGKNILKKCYEISYALFRVSSYFPNPSLKDTFEGRALALLEAAAIQDYARLAKITVAVEYLIQFGGDIGFVHKDNALLLTAELHILETMIAEPGETTAQAAIPLDDIFREPRHHSSPPRENPEPMKVEMETPVEVIEAAGDEGEVSGNAAMRQSAILERMRQSGNCRLKDIQEIFPGTSERTIRYDLQSLLEQNLIERIGNGGPSVYYRVRQMAG